MSRLFCLLLLAIFIPQSYADEHILTPLLGTSNWSDNTGHTARGSTLSFRDRNELTKGFRYLYLLDNGFAFGGDIYGYKKDVTTTSQANEAGVVHLHALAEYFFIPRGEVSPFVGVGMGISAIGFSGGILDEEGTGGTSVELNGGVLFRLSEIVGLQVEYKYTRFDIDANIDKLYTNIDTNANSLLLGLTIHI